MKETGRDIRRAERDRIIKARRQHYNGWACSNNRAQGKVATTSTLCSCWMCGNPRRKLKGIDRLTMQERKASLSFE